MKTYELTPEELASLSEENQKLYKKAISFTNDGWANGPYGGWVRGFDILKEMGWTETKREEGHRTFVGLRKPEFVDTCPGDSSYCTTMCHEGNRCVTMVRKIKI